MDEHTIIIISKQIQGEILHNGFLHCRVQFPNLNRGKPCDFMWSINLHFIPFNTITFILLFLFRQCNGEIRLGAVHKLCLQVEGSRWSKKSNFCKLLYHRKCKRRGVGGQKKPNFVNVVCERPLTVEAWFEIRF